ncbi:MAG: phosphoribosylaminoimidazolesuccinocarboxamide synthase [Deltaproteobacteria bacterium]|nr:phosphoribosylaminoimidazolesuccinocarboxamide synthase [Deltaproteobacteria bacterium]
MVAPELRTSDIHDRRELFRNQLPHTLRETAYSTLGSRYGGKVRDSYVREGRRVLIATDRLSAFDVILTTIPFKGQILTQMAAYWFRETATIARNHVIDQPHPNVLITEEVEILPIEVVIRGYLAGSAWRDYSAGKPISGISLPAGMQEFQKLERPLITPSTKAPSGTHDEPISREEIIASGKASEKVWDEVCERATGLFAFGQARAAERGLILVDTKYEFGLRKSGEVVLADEIHTPDSSRYWISSSYNEHLSTGTAPVMLDKEFFRRWLIERGYMGNGTPPEIGDEVRVDLGLRYAQIFEQITGGTFSGTVGPIEDKILAAIEGHHSIR